MAARVDLKGRRITSVMAGEGGGGFVTSVMVGFGPRTRHQLPATHSDVREGQGQKGVPAGPGPLRGPPYLFGKRRRPTERAPA